MGSMNVFKDRKKGNISKSTWFVRSNVSATMDSSLLPTKLEVVSRCPYFGKTWCCVLPMPGYFDWYRQIAHIVEFLMQQTVCP